MVKVNLYGQIQSNIKENLQIIELQDMVCINGQIIVYMKEMLRMD